MPVLADEVSRFSADATQEEETGQTHHTARIRIAAEAERFGGLRLVPGMAAETHVQMGHRAVVSAVVGPLSDQVAKAWER